MFLLKSIIKKFIKNSHMQDYFIIIFVFSLFSLFFGLFLMFYENYSLIDTYYYLITTATTVGYGDFSPKTTLGKFLVTFYMVIGIAIIGIFLGKMTDIVLNLSTQKKKGNITMKHNVDLLIIGYPSSEKLSKLVSELRKDERFTDAVIVNINNKIEEKPLWMQEHEVEFIKGVASDTQILKRANIEQVTTALILANDPANIESDDYSTSVCGVIEKIAPNVKTIVEKVRQENIIFETVNADVIIDVTSANVLAQEILDPGAIELQNAIFSNDIEGTQYNLEYQGEITPWKDVAIKILLKNAIPEGFKNPEHKTFNLLPRQEETIETGALIKYRSNKPIVELE